MAKRKLKMTKKAIAARRRYRAKRAGVPARRKNVRPKRGRGAGVGGTYGGIKRGRGGAISAYSGKKSGVIRRGKRNSPQGAGFWDDVGGFFENVGRTALNLLPMML